MEYALEKWGGRPHYRGVVHHLGDDAFGSWIWGPKGRTIYRGDEVVFVTEQHALTVIVPGAWWAPAWWIGHPRVAMYVNINTPAAWDDERIVSTDMDLDVVRFTDGRAEIVDRDELEVHSARYGYPRDVVIATEEAASRALELVIANEPPFDGAAAAAWTERALDVFGP